VVPTGGSLIKAFIISMTFVVLLSGLRPPFALAASLLLATDDTPGNSWIMGGGDHFQKKYLGWRSSETGS
jgi:hypothetical protein